MYTDDHWAEATMDAEPTMYCQRCGQPTGEREVDGRMRPVCTSCGAVTWVDPKLAVAVVIERDGEVLLGLRADGAREAGKWGIPAGFVDRGDVVEAVAVREMAEETGLTVELGPVLSVVSHPGEPVVLVVFAATGFSGEPRPGDDLADLGWFTPDALPELAFAHDADILATWGNWRALRLAS